MPMSLPADSLPKARRYMRALRRAVVAYWYATLEGKDAAHIEAARAATVVNVLDEAVFETALGQAYRDLRARDRLGQVATGLELVRNCEIHAAVDAPDLLVESRLISVPLATTPGQLMRGVYKWANELDLPDEYKNLPSDAPEGARRARGEARHGYRQAVQGRVVAETLLDAIQWFQGIEPSLVVDAPVESRYSYAEVPATNAADDSDGQSVPIFIAPLSGLDANEVVLPDLATRWHERRDARTGASDEWFSQAVRQAKTQAPVEPRSIRGLIRDEDKIVGYGGSTPTDWGQSTWVERAAQVRRDVDAGVRYVVAHEDGVEVAVSAGDHQSVVAKVGDRDLMLLLPDSEPPIDFDRLRLVEEYPDAYLDMRVRGF